MLYFSPEYKEKIETAPYDRLATIEIVLANMPV